MKKQDNAGNTGFQSDKKQTKFHLDLYYKVTLGYTALVGVLYAALTIAYNKGFILIKTSVQYWLWYALVIGIVLVVGKFVNSLPKKASLQRTVRICTAIFSICTLVLMYVQCLQYIDTGFNKCATIKDGDREVILMRADLNLDAVKSEEEGAEETGESVGKKTYTLYKAYPALNALFCDGRNADDLIWLVDDPDAEIHKEWSDEGLTLWTEGVTMAQTGDDGSKQLDTLHVTFR